jgi:hypothetical protein
VGVECLSSLPQPKELMNLDCRCCHSFTWGYWQSRIHGFYFHWSGSHESRIGKPQEHVDPPLMRRVLLISMNVRWRTASTVETGGKSPLMIFEVSFLCVDVYSFGSSDSPGRGYRTSS